jgi:hypothetical protein
MGQIMMLTQEELARRSVGDYSLSLYKPEPRRAVDWMMADTIELPVFVVTARRIDLRKGGELSTLDE